MNYDLPYFIKTKDDNISFVIFYFPPKEYFIGFPKLLATTERTKINIDGIYYNRLKGYKKWFFGKLNKIRRYLKYSENFGEKIYIFQKKDIKKIYHPLDFYKNILKDKSESCHIKNTVELIKSISRLIGINKKDIGIEGSTLFSYFNENSDIDVLIYGYKNAIKIAGGFYELAQNKNIRIYNGKNSSAISRDKKNLEFGGNKKNIIIQEARRFYGFIRGKRFSIINVLNNGDKPNINLNRKIKYIGLFKNILSITDVKYSIVTPSILLGRTLNGERYRVELITHYGINQARKNDKFFIKGKIYQDIVTQEKIIIISFWSRIKQQFDLITR